MRLSRALAALLLAAVAAPAAAGPTLNDDPADVFAQLERRLLASPHALIEEHVQVSGVFESQLHVQAEARAGNHLALSVSGRHAGAPVDAHLESDGRGTVITSDTRKREEGAGAEQNYALLVGLLRMGLLQNAARAADAQAPDHAGGNAGKWVTVENFHHATFAQSGPLEGTYAFGFDVLVNGDIVGSARLWLDPVSGLPRHREQTIQLPHGEYTEVEDYLRFDLE